MTDTRFKSDAALKTDTLKGATGQSMQHESAVKHVTGAALYVDDLAEPRQLLHAAVGQSPVACGIIRTLDLSAVLAAPGVAAVLTLADIPGHIDIGPVFPGDPILADGAVKFHGQPLFAVAADTLDNARRAALLAHVEIEEAPPLLDPQEAIARNQTVRPVHTMQRGDAAAAIAKAPHVLEASLSVGGQEHYYLEGQVSMVAPTEDGGMQVWCSTQHPSEVQKLVAEVLHLPIGAVTVETRRMGGAFGGKETHAAQWACLAALLANKTRRPVKMRLPRAMDMMLTGKRHAFENRYRVGFDDSGLLLGADITVIGNCGCSPDLSDAIVDRAMFHADNAYFLPAATITGHRAFTNMVSATAFRGFGGPQGMLIIEKAMDDMARALGKDPLEVRKRNLYQGPDRNLTPYHQTVSSETLTKVIQELEISSDYWARRQQISDYNAGSPLLKKGLALTPVKFGISFTVQHLNQAGALIHVYTDGSIHLNHGGTEMGQGLNTKVAQVVAEELQVDLQHIHITATRTDKVPNTSPTAASSGADLNGQAARDAARTIRLRLAEYLVEQQGALRDSIRFANNQVQFENSSGAHCMSFAKLAEAAYMARVSLSATGYYRTPKIHYDRNTASGRPFFYYATGAAVSEVLVDTLTGEYRVLRVDILHDVGRSLNPALDKGQVEGGFIQGMGWLTTEELRWDEQGRLLTTGAATYKIPTAADIPPVFNVALMEDQPNEEATIYHSKAVGEPPFMLAISVWSALRDAISSVADYNINPPLDTPATPERVFWAIQAAQQAAATHRNGANTP
ncbi:xanthine dehydrogenase molybdopterin binding subunit [Ketobacter sp.]|uniref:xanthine dehydrogenase molybdopterin binding subunit n=1 Tax=Ketobacter sp. TaxID=2083498 RepID=UPI000F0DB901|nr:xanthine dehydrogenase molybdopterin binding subunit [Ketobacter sp.]RLT92071.1 MAG: xanthine dehydrogenase molybdopterin binding subunit [Ketobacter sp.]